MKKNQMKNLLAVIALGVLSVPALAAQKDCENLAHAKRFNAGFQKQFLAVGKAMNEREGQYSKKVQAIKARLVDARVWTPEQATQAVKQLGFLDEDALDAHATRLEASDDFKVKLRALESVELATANDKVTLAGSKCVMGYDVIEKYQTWDVASSAVWELLIRKLAKVAAENNVSID
jgi:hypothetical protein